MKAFIKLVLAAAVGVVLGIVGYNMWRENQGKSTATP